MEKDHEKLESEKTNLEQMITEMKSDYAEQIGVLTE